MSDLYKTVKAAYKHCGGSYKDDSGETVIVRGAERKEAHKLVKELLGIPTRIERRKDEDGKRIMENIAESSMRICNAVSLWLLENMPVVEVKAEKQLTVFEEEETNTTEGQQIGYIRVSSVGQNTARQLDGITLDRTFTDKLSGKNTDRPELQLMLKHIRKHDTVHIHHINRLGRNARDILNLVHQILETGASLSCKSLNITLTNGENDITSKIMLHSFAMMAEIERDNINTAQREGIAKAKEKGVYSGRARAITDEQISELIDDHKAGFGVSALSKKYGVSRPAVYRYIKGSK